jgi:hypothetical protein
MRADTRLVETGQQQLGRHTPDPLTGSPPRVAHPGAALPPPGRRGAAASRGPLARLTAGGSDGNEQLTVLTGIVLFVLLAALGVTIVRIHPLIWEHLFIGLLLLGPVALKLGSTGYRFVRYYTRDPVYRRKGPPSPYLRLLGPLVVLSTVVVFASGVALLLLGPSSRSTLLLVHKASFFVWLGATAVHVLGHLPEVTRALNGGREIRVAVLSEVADGIAQRPNGRPPDTQWPASGPAAGPGSGRVAGPRSEHAAGPESSAGTPDLRAGRAGRALALTGALLAGLVLALLLIPEFGPWLTYHRVFIGH